jgi:pilus assembly protein Flp/PilA
MSKIMQSIRRFAKRTDGASGIEYAIVAAMVAVVIAAFMGSMKSGLDNVFNDIKTALPAAQQSSGS